ncbi:MAG: hypothetical protein IPH09_16205 [bacterium]|nr:hypothetical protein [bacterium]MBK9305427.1 hypothetical protein [bacterium]
MLLATAVAASAQQDAFCICLDPMNPNTCGGNVVIPVGVPTNIYLCLLNPSGSRVICWEARITDSRQDGDMLGEWSMFGLDAYMDPYDYGVVPETQPAVPNAANVVVLGIMWVRVLNETAPVEFFVGPVPGSASFPQGVPGYVHTLGLDTPATVCSGDFAEPVFSINGVVAAAESTWGAIKGAYMAGSAAGR